MSVVKFCDRERRRNNTPIVSLSCLPMSVNIMTTAGGLAHSCHLITFGACKPAECSNRKRCGLLRNKTLRPTIVYDVANFMSRIDFKICMQATFGSKLDCFLILFATPQKLATYLW